jgi:hypothetical protein
MKDDHLCRAVHNVISLKRNCFRHAAAVCAKAVPTFMSGLSGMMLLCALHRAKQGAAAIRGLMQGFRNVRAVPSDRAPLNQPRFEVSPDLPIAVLKRRLRAKSKFRMYLSDDVKLGEVRLEQPPGQRYRSAPTGFAEDLSQGNAEKSALPPRGERRHSTPQKFHPCDNCMFRRPALALRPRCPPLRTPRAEPPLERFHRVRYVPSGCPSDHYEGYRSVEHATILCRSKCKGRLLPLARSASWAPQSGIARSNHGLRRLQQL